MTMKSFQKIHGAKSIGEVYLNRVAKATSRQQLEDYYKNVANLTIGRIEDAGKMTQLSETDILYRFQKNQQPILAFGSLFWAHDFGVKQPYPLKEFVSLMGNPLYRNITAGLQTKYTLIHKAQEAIQKVIGSKNGF